MSLSELQNLESASITHSDRRLYLWVPSHEVGFIQALVDGEDNLARIRTERHEATKKRSLLVFMFSSSREAEVLQFLEDLRLQAEVPWTRAEL